MIHHSIKLTRFVMQAVKFHNLIHNVMIMAVRVVGFSNGGYKIRSIVALNQHTHRIL